MKMRQRNKSSDFLEIRCIKGAGHALTHVMSIVQIAPWVVGVPAGDQMRAGLPRLPEFRERGIARGVKPAVGCSSSSLNAG